MCVGVLVEGYCGVLLWVGVVIGLFLKIIGCLVICFSIIYFVVLVLLDVDMLVFVGMYGIFWCVR